MYNYYIRRGAIWKIKGANSSYRDFLGMGFTDRLVLILSNYRDENDIQKFTYLIIEDSKVSNYKSYMEVVINNRVKYIETDRLLTGDVRALSNYVCDISSVDMEQVLNTIKLYFNIFRKPPKVTQSIKIEGKNKKKQITIHKFGIDIYVTEGPGVSVAEKSKRLILSDKVKQDIIYNSKTDEDIKVLSDKYSIYPTKAIREIRNRLVYQHKQKEG